MIFSGSQARDSHHLPVAHAWRVRLLFPINALAGTLTIRYGKDKLGGVRARKALTPKGPDPENICNIWGLEWVYYDQTSCKEHRC